MCAGIDEGACGAGDFGVVALALEVEGDLLHIGCPVDFSVFIIELVTASGGALRL